MTEGSNKVERVRAALRDILLGTIARIDEGTGNRGYPGLFRTRFECMGRWFVSYDVINIYGSTSFHRRVFGRAARGVPYSIKPSEPPDATQGIAVGGRNEVCSLVPRNTTSSAGNPPSFEAG